MAPCKPAREVACLNCEINSSYASLSCRSTFSHSIQIFEDFFLTFQLKTLYVYSNLARTDEQSNQDAFKFVFLSSNSSLTRPSYKYSCLL